MHDQLSGKPTQFTLVAFLFEASLAFVALGIGWLLDRSPLATMDMANGAEVVRACGWGALSAIPLFALVVLADYRPVGPLRNLRRTVRQHVAPLFRNTGIGGLLSISLAAGVGEEMLFRGVVQPAVAEAWGPPGGTLVGLGTASVLFGLCHWISPAYALLAGLIGLWLGTLQLLTGNLAAPITMHALYDLLALIYLVHGPAGRVPDA